MTENRLPTEVELVYEVMSCNAMRTAQEPLSNPHPCGYFRKWGTYHSYDYALEGPPPEKGVVHEARYVGRAPLVPELLSGCRKAPIMSVGINPNLPGWWRGKRGSLNPLFNDYKQYAHYFRYRAVSKLELSEEDYEAFGGGAHDTPFSDFELKVGEDAKLALHLAPQKMYEAYEELLQALAKAMGWEDAKLALGEDLTYGNMVASPSAKWITKPDEKDPSMPPMTEEERDGIVSECFRHRRYFLRQLFQALPAVLLVFSQNTARAFIGEMGDRFTVGAPQPDEPFEELMKREVRLRYGDADGEELDARVIFSPHITGTPEVYEAARDNVVAQLVEEAKAGRIGLNPKTGHLQRGKGACVFCPMLEVGPCDYEQELKPLSKAPQLTADSPIADVQAEKTRQAELMAGVVESAPPVAQVWSDTDDPQEVSE